jgi:hypothetical protein
VQLLNFSAASSYNFAADSLRLSNLALNGRTRMFGQVDVNMSATVSPYGLSADGSRVVDRFVFSPGRVALGRLTSMNVSARTSVRSPQRGDARPAVAPRAGMMDPFADGMGQFGSPFGGPAQMPSTASMTPYTDFAIPWSLNLDMSYSVFQPLLTSNRSATINASGDFNLTPNWKVTFMTGYDLIRGDVALTNLNITRDFECWQMSLNWIPLGPYRSYGFQLYVKSSQLSNLLRISQPRSDVQGRFAGDRFF